MSVRPLMSTTLGVLSPVKLVLFDVFDTLCTPRIPIHEQYAEEAEKAGLRGITPQSVRDGFRSAFKSISTTYPLYGKHSNPPLKPEEWWTNLIQKCMETAGADLGELNTKMKFIGPSLLARFESDHGYRNFDETLHCLKTLKDMGVSTSIVSNADSRILKTLSSLSILPLLTHPPTLSWDVEFSKPSPRIFELACQACGVIPGEGVLMVGDELVADYQGAISVGIEGRLIRRVGDWSDGAVRVSGEDLEGVHVVQDLTDVVDEVRRRNGSQ